MVALAIGVAAAVVLNQAPRYASATRLFVTTPVSESGLAGAYEGTLFTQQRVRSYADLVESDLLASRVIEAEGLKVDPATLAAQVSAAVVPETVLLDITVIDSSPQDAQELASAYADQFVSLISEIEEPPAGGDPLVGATVVNTADLPESPVAPQPVRTLTLAGVIGLMLGVGLVILRDVLDTTISSPSELEGASEAPILGVIPNDADAPKHPLISEIAPKSPRAEAFRHLRTNLQFLDVDVKRKVITVTSPIPDEGKTSTAVNLAIALADAGVRVLLLEADLRRPKAAGYLGLVGEVGLTDILVGRIGIEQAIQDAGRHGIRVIASGASPPNPSELLQSQAMVALLKSLEDLADVVLIDSPPLLSVTDATILATLSDGAILVVRHKHSTVEQVRQVVTTLEQVGGRILGSVLCRAPSKGRDAYGYGYGQTIRPRMRPSASMGGLAGVKAYMRTDSPASIPRPARKHRRRGRGRVAPRVRSGALPDAGERDSIARTEDRAAERDAESPPGLGPIHGPAEDPGGDS